MKNLILVLGLLISFACFDNVYPQNKASVIETINEKIETIQLDTLLKSITLQNQEFLKNSSHNGELTAFHKNKNIYSIYQSIGIPEGYEVIQYFYWKKKLIYVHARFNSYVIDDSTKTPDYTKLNTTFKGVYYFHKEKLVHKETNGSYRFKNSDKETEKQLLEESYNNVKLLSKHLGELVK